MPLFLLPYPVIDPVMVHLGPFPIRWYAMGYIVSLIAGWLIAARLARSDALWGDVRRPRAERLDDLLVYVAFGAVLGGRTGYVLFYNLPYFLQHPLEIPQVWNGGMSFHGGLTGAALGAYLFSRREKISFLSVGDLCCAVAPIGLFLVRIANFIKPELWGRPTDVPWAMIFPGAGPLPRHPSQLYEAGLEGIALGIILALAVRAGAFRRPGLTSGLFIGLYGLARIFCEFFREPDPQLGFLFGGATMGMILSVPLVLLGALMVFYSLRRARPAARDLAAEGR
ncbi:prolipoprotein diacylglyceryl transferase [Rhodoblastus acidophilus]|uniref:Phosphatidylglycerol--prolipoprotein diacylglyceryl transferase n=1 Tax=Candidatus Rhodoblastus alkanivorans TaxID=2954117 RepID=A0ABS9Z9D5_9HYPH|nr:prolipoprotein diacylglyceryl transferase [Candidatus Rhodoblastus alkanivorans]MCI4678884.1 prolipoprotein diacylglyceryl transferase [Candidatus Rhodoblastus alkanivorans]MCI4684192.1 prolipoprotein diacylglyceryl transferase [Candidatus Rhodoblastus alkanivorans]MDI4641513.1 prolipoprotein diacylglyceryl transferase [Rhodoblastus acidophilus]